MKWLDKFIVSERGQWDHPGKPTAVPTKDGRITMQGVPYPVFAMDETGYGGMIYPGGNYQFPGNMVYEVPMANGGDISIPDLSRPNWLDKAQKGKQVKYYDDYSEYLKAAKAEADSSLAYQRDKKAYESVMNVTAGSTFPYEEILKLVDSNEQFYGNRTPGYSPKPKVKPKLDQQAVMSKIFKSYPGYSIKFENDKIFIREPETEAEMDSGVRKLWKPLPIEKKNIKPEIKKLSYKEDRLKMSDKGLAPITYMPLNNTAAVLSKIKEEDMYKQGPKVVPAPTFKSGGWLEKYQDGSQVTYVDDSNDPRLQDYQTRMNLWKYSQLPNLYHKQTIDANEILSGVYNQEDLSKDRISSRENPTAYDTDIYGPYGSKNEIIDIPINELNKFIANPEFTFPARSGIYRGEDIVKKYPPAYYKGFSEYTSNPYQELYPYSSDKFFGTNKYMVEPKTQFIEDRIDRNLLKKIYPNLSDEMIDERVKQSRENPEYYTNIWDPDTGWYQTATVDSPQITPHITNQNPTMIDTVDGIYPKKHNILYTDSYSAPKGYTYKEELGYLQEAVTDNVLKYGEYYPMWNAPESRVAYLPPNIKSKEATLPINAKGLKKGKVNLLPDREIIQAKDTEYDANTRMYSKAIQNQNPGLGTQDYAREVRMGTDRYPVMYSNDKSYGEFEVDGKKQYITYRKNEDDSSYTPIVQESKPDEIKPKQVKAPVFKYGGWLEQYQDAGEVKTYTSDPNYFNNRAVFVDNPQANDLVRSKIYAGTHGWDPSSNSLVKLDKPVAVPEAVQEMSTADWGKKSSKQRFESDTPAGKATRKAVAAKEMEQAVTNPYFRGAIPAMLAAPAIAAAGPSVLSALNAPAVLGSTTLPGVTAGNALGAIGAADALVNRFPQVPGQLSRGEYRDAAINALTGGLDLYGANMVSPLYKGAKAAAQKTGDFLTTQTPLQHTHLLNPWSFHRRVNKTNPSTDFVYRTLGKQEGFENTVNSGFITPKPGGRYKAAFYNPGYPLLRYDDWSGTGSRYIAEVPTSNPKIMSRYTDSPDPYRVTKDIDREGLGHVGINEPGVTIYREDWLRGYKPVKLSQKSQTSDDEIIRQLLKAGNKKEISKMLAPKSKKTSTVDEPFLKIYPELDKQEQMYLMDELSGRWGNETNYWRGYNKRMHGLDYDRPIPKFFDPTIPVKKQGGWLDNY